MITPYVPYPPASGGQIRTLNLLKYLKNKVDITLVCLYKTDKEKTLANKLKSFCKEIYLCKRPKNPWSPALIIKAVFSTKPFLIIRNFSKDAEELIKKLLKKEEFDAIHAETFYVMPHLPDIDIPVLLVEQTIEYNVYKHFVETLPVPIRYLFYLDIIQLKFWEKYYWKKSTYVACVSIPDQKEINKTDKNIPTVVIPNGAGDDMFVQKLPKKNFKKPILLFVGNFLWLQNTEAAKIIIDKIAPLVKEHIPQAQIIIAGQHLKKKFPLSPNSNLELKEIAANDTTVVKNLYRKAHIFISPLKGPGGTRLKILGAMAAGLPIVGSRVSVSGLNLKSGEDYLLAERPSEFVKQIKRILSDQNLYYRMQKHAYLKAKQNFSWKKIAEKLNSIYEKII